MHFYDLGQKAAMLELIEDSLRTKFGETGVELMPAIKELGDGQKFRALNKTIAGAASVDEVRKACSRAARAIRRKKTSNAEQGSPKP